MYADIALILSNAESGFRFRESFNLETHFSSKSLDLHLLRFPCPFLAKPYHYLFILFMYWLGISQDISKLINKDKA